MQEFESTRLQETLTAFSDDGKMSIKYGRALRKGEYRVKVYHLDLNKPNESSKLLCETGEDWKRLSQIPELLFDVCIVSVVVAGCVFRRYLRCCSWWRCR